MSNELKKFIHDVTTPLTMVKLNLEHLNTGSDNFKSNQYLRRIKSGIDELDYLLAMNNTNTTPVVFRSTVIKELRKILLLYDISFRQHKISLRLDFTEDYFLLESGDKFHRIMINLINNAIDAFENLRDGKLLSITTLRVEDGFVLKVADNGKGIKKADLAHIFNYKFTTKPNGRGLGLYNVKNLLLENFNGFITCSSEEGKGSEFEIFLPDPQ
jgi:signal transduction histidine kinase